MAGPGVAEGWRVIAVERTPVSLHECQNRIDELVSWLVTQVEGFNASGRTDINVLAEDLLVPLFRLVYGYEHLENLNLTEHANYPAIDLADKGRRIAIQITSTGTGQKIRDTLDMFVRHGLHEQYDRLIVYVLVRKQKSYSPKGFAAIVQDRFDFDASCDILDYTDLLREARRLPSDKARAMLRLLEEYLCDDGSPLPPLSSDAYPNILTRMVIAGSNLALDRGRLVDELQAFASGGNGIVVGPPGVGKSHCLAELATRMLQAGELCLYVPVDQVDAGSGGQLGAALGIRGDTVKFLRNQSILVNGRRGTVIIDAFDAARSDDLRRSVLTFVGRVAHELAGSWTVIVSARTYDAARSQDLQRLFPSAAGVAAGDPYQLVGVHCRHFAVPLLTETETVAAAAANPRLAAVHGKASDDLRDLLRTPFNLWLLDSLVSGSEGAPDLTGVVSEAQLLRRYWEHRVMSQPCSTQRAMVLTVVTRAMVRANSLSVRKDEVFEHSAGTAWEGLMSSGVLVHTPLSEQRIRFPHNMLFDYAVAELLIERDPDGLVRFISDEPSRPVFLRPSLVYYFTKLWHESRQVFWQVLWQLIRPTPAVHIRLFGRLVPFSVIAGEARDVQDLRPLMDAVGASQPEAETATLRLLQAISVSNLGRDELWISFLDEILGHLKPDFVWDVATLAEKIAKRAQGKNGSVWSMCGQIGRRLADWFWKGMARGGDDWLVGVGSRLILPLVVQTYDTDPSASRTVLAKALDLVGQQRFPIETLRAITHGIDGIYPHDAAFTTAVYLRLFGYIETSDETVSWGGRVIQLTSTRRQDYEMCLYQLGERFPGFLHCSPVLATETVIQCCTSHAALRRRRYDSETDPELPGRLCTFEFHGRTVRYINNSDIIWRSPLHEEPLVKMVSDLFEFVGGLARDGDVCTLESILAVFGNNACLSVFWRRLLEVAAQHPSVFADQLFDLCLAPAVQTDPECTEELGQFLQAAAHEFTPVQLRRVEESIMDIPGGGGCLSERPWLVYVRDELLLKIPRELLVTTRAKRHQTKTGVRRRAEILERETSRAATLGGRAEGRSGHSDTGETRVVGVESERLSRLTRCLEEFHGNWLNRVPPVDEVRALLPAARDAYEMVSCNPAEPIQPLFAYLGAFVRMMSCSAEVLAEDEFAFCREVAVQCAACCSRPAGSGEEDDWPKPDWSDACRSDAAKAMPWLARHRADERILQTVLELAEDPSSSVRSSLLTNLGQIRLSSPGTFWLVLRGRAEAEADKIALHALLNCLNSTLVEAEQNCADVLARFAKRLLAPNASPNCIRSTDSDLLAAFVSPVAWLALIRRNESAVQVIGALLRNPIDNSRVVRELAAIALDYVIAFGEGAPTEDVQRHALDLLMRAVEVSTEGIAELRSVPREQWNESLTERLRQAYDIIHRVVVLLRLALRQEGESQRAPAERSALYFRTKPLLCKVLSFAADPDYGVMSASTAHDLMELLNSTLACDPGGVLHMATDVVASGRQAGYHLDSLAVGEVVKLVEAVLADHREVLKDEAPLTDLLDLLDVFAEAGWPEARALAYRLEEVFR